MGKKGQIPWCKGMKFTDEHKENLSKSHLGKSSGAKGYKHTEETKLKISKSNLGKLKYFTQEHCNNISKSKKGVKLSEENKKHLSESHLGKKLTEEHKNNISKALSGKIFKKHKIKRFGEKSPGWKGGITSIYLSIRNCDKYLEWRTLIFKRDNYTCKNCGQISGKLEVHHIKTFSKICKENNIKNIEESLSCNELWDLNNGITLCKNCHKKLKGEN